MPFNLKSHHRTILPLHLQINVIIVLSLDSFLGLFKAMANASASTSSAATSQIDAPGLAQHTPKTPRRFNSRLCFSKLVNITVLKSQLMIIFKKYTKSKTIFYFQFCLMQLPFSLKEFHKIKFSENYVLILMLY